MSTLKMAEFWNGNIDPFNRRRISENQVPAAWQKAVSAFLSPEMRHALSGMGHIHGRRILLLGAGLGQGTVPLARLNASVIGLDIARIRCGLARKMTSGEPEGKKITFVTANAERLPFSTGSFQAVLAQDVLMYSDPSRIFRECARILTPKGKAVFVESMDGHPFLKLFRNFFYGKRMRAFTRFLRYEELKSLSDPGLHFENIRGFYFLSIIAFSTLYFLHSIPMYQGFLAILYPMDRILLKIMPGLSQRTWKGVAVYGRHPASLPAEGRRIEESSS